MKCELRKKFLPNGYLQEAFIQLHDFAQRDLSVAYYTEEVDNLMLKCGIAEPDEKTIARYLCGLRKEIYDVVILQPFISYNDVYKLAAKVEKQVKEKEGRKSASYGICRGPNRGYTTNRASGTQSTKPVATKASYTPQPHDVGPVIKTWWPRVMRGVGCKEYNLEAKRKGLDVYGRVLKGSSKKCTLPTQGMRSIISTVSISPNGFLPSILLLVVIIVTVVIVVTVILVVVVVVIIGVVIVVMIIGHRALLHDPLTSGLCSRAIFIGQESFQFSPGYLVGLLYSNRSGIGIPPEQGILGEST
nr:reverse transcriptase domain-containing protein [Tanacetum cinerariifolium]